MEQQKQNDFSSSTCRRARSSTVVVAAIMYIAELVAADAFLAKLLIRLGISEARIGVISSLISFSFLIQLVTLVLLQRKFSYKKMTLTFRVAGITALGLMYLLPLVPLAKRVLQILAIFLILFGNLSQNLVFSTGFRWTNEFVDPRGRASFAAFKEAVSLVVGIVASLGGGFVFDHLSESGKVDEAFLFFAILLLLVALGTLICYLRIPDVNIYKEGQKRSLRESIRQTLGNPRFRPYLLLVIMWEVGRYFTVGFLGTFKTEDLGMSLLTIQIINTASLLLRLAVTGFFGKYSDKHTCVGGMELAFWIALAAFLCIVFTTTKTWVLIVIFTILYQVSLAGIDQNLCNSCYNYVPKEYITEALIFRGAIGGICGFLSSFVAGLLFDGVDNARFLGMMAQQWFAVISCLMLVACILYAHFVVRKISVEVQ